MTKEDFKPDTRYTLTWRDESGRAKPLNLYVYRVYDKFMVARETSGGGLLRRIGYENVERIVHEHAVAPAERFFIPGAVLDEKTWRDRAEMQLYSSAPGRGK
ncbi:MAG: hypothetical protein MUF79_12460 [Burkholderiales bacterium]|jgi:hypothetical protein|nr:hypothetical protein [Burkholderiales bacterium]